MLVVPGTTVAVACSAYGSAREGLTPCACTGRTGTGATVGVVVLPSARLAASRAVVSGSDETRSASLGVAKLKHEVRSPTTARRHALMLVSTTPKRFSMKRIVDVWSNTCELTHPPLLHGEITYSGTRGPRPNGWCLYGSTVVMPPSASPRYSSDASTVLAPASRACAGSALQVT